MAQTVANLGAQIKQAQRMEQQYRGWVAAYCAKLGANNPEHARCLLRIAELEAELLTEHDEREAAK